MALQIVVPMAGEGRRFREAGYGLPKPLIPVSGVPMAVRAVRDHPAAERIVFMVRLEHMETFDIAKRLAEQVPGCSILPVDGLTDGQACTVELAEEALDPEAPVLVCACDNTHLYDADAFAAAVRDPATECLVWTYRGEPRVALQPEQYGWVRVEGDRVVSVSCKKPISHTPLDDHVISGCFWFRRARTMFEGIRQMLEQNTQVNGEYYMDLVPNVLIEQGLTVRVFEVEKYVGWGTPADLEDYRRWERYFEGLKG